MLCLVILYKYNFFEMNEMKMKIFFFLIYWKLQINQNLYIIL